MVQHTTAEIREECHPTAAPHGAVSAMKEGNKLPVNNRNMRWAVTIHELQRWARETKRDIDAEREQPEFKEAFQNFHRAFWNWIDAVNPANLRQKIYAADMNCFKMTGSETVQDAEFFREYYQFWRAVFLDGLTHGERYKPKHTKHFALLGNIAALIDDQAILKAATPPKWNWKKAKVQNQRTPIERQLKFCLLVSWLASGLWRMETRDSQLDALKKMWPEMPYYTVAAIEKAESRLGLKWFKPASDK